MKTYFVLEKGRLVTVIQTKMDNVKIDHVEGRVVVDYDWVVENPQEAEKQIAEWKAKNE